MPEPSADVAPDLLAISHPSGTRRQIWAAILSAFFPRAGQFLIGQRRKGAVLLSSFILLAMCVWALHVPRHFLALILVILLWLGLQVYANCSALLAKTSAASVPSKLWVLAVLPAIYIGFNLVFTPLFLLAGFRALKFSSSAMEPTLCRGDKFLTDRIYYRREPLRHDDLVVVQRSGISTVKRVVALAGDTIEVRNRDLLVNGSIVKEPFIQHTRPPGTDAFMDTFGPITVPAGKIFVMGDNRDVSLDSRTPEFGLLSTDAIIGKPLYIYGSPLKGRTGKELQ